MFVHVQEDFRYPGMDRFVVMTNVGSITWNIVYQGSQANANMLADTFVLIGYSVQTNFCHPRFAPL